MSSNKALLLRFYDEVACQGNLDLIDELIDEDLIEHDEFPGLEPNRDGVKKLFAYFKSAFPDGRFDAEQLVEEGDLVTALVRITGTHQGEFLGVQPTGKRVDVLAFDLLRFRDGRAVEHWGVTDAMKLMQQLGAVPGPPA